MLKNRVTNSTPKRVENTCPHKTCTWIIHNKQEVGTIQTSIDQWMDKSNVVYLYCGILFGNKKAPRNATAWIKLESKWKKPHKWPHIVWFHLNDLCWIGQSTKTENRWMVA